MKILVTGADGFVGKYVLDALRGQHTVTATTLLAGGVDSAAADAVIQLDITDAEATKQAIMNAEPDWIIHLAGFSSVAESFKKPELTHRINVDGSRNVFQAARSLSTFPRILSIGSADEYGIVGPEPITEEHSLNAESPYGKSKRVVEELVNDEFADLVILTRSFPHTGPGQAKGFVVPDFAYQIAAIEAGKQEPLMKVGNLDASRDLSDVRDVVRAYVLLLEKGQPGQVYNVCSGQAVAMSEVLEELLALSDTTITVEQDASKVRPVDLPILVGDNSKLCELGWQPKIPLNQTLEDVLNYWREQQKIEVSRKIEPVERLSH